MKINSKFKNKSLAFTMNAFSILFKIIFLLFQFLNNNGSLSQNWSPIYCSIKYQLQKVKYNMNMNMKYQFEYYNCNFQIMEEGKRQVKKSYSEFNDKLMETNQPIHDVRIKNEQLQKNSRLFDERRAQQRLAAIQQEAVISNKKNTALQIKWSELKEHEECESLHKEIQQQKESFNMIIGAKDRLIKEFQNELKRKDDSYSKTLKSQSEDIKVLVAKMRQQYFALRDQSLNELDSIQTQFQQQRKEYIDNAKNEVQDCFNKHIKMEQDFADNRKKAEDDFEKKIDELRIEGMQIYTSTKIRMQTDIQNLQKCYEEMKAIYQLNTEKLDYNLIVLKTKRQQNHNAHEQLKKKVRILNLKLRNLRTEYEKADHIFKQKNKGFTTEYKRITRQFKELQRKFKHFQRADLERYNEIQSMNEKQVHELKQKIIKCDIVIHNQQLGMEWAGTPQEQEKEKENVVAIGEQEESEEIQLLVSEEKLMEMLDYLIEEADFIFDDKMREELERAGNQQKLKQKLDILKKTLQIDSTDELNLFIDEMANRCKYMSEKQKHVIEEAKLKKLEEAREEEQRRERRRRRGGEEKKVQQSVEVPQQQEEEPRVDLKSDFKVDPVLVVDFLVDWMNSKEQRKKILERTAKKSLKQLSDRQKKERIAKEGKKYWQKLTQVLPERTFRIWKVMDKALTKYYELLLARQKLIDETGQMHNQNEELKNLLNQYLQINHELIIPPTRLMQRDG